MTKIYAIRNKQSGEFISFGAKIAWAREANAKNAFNLHLRQKFDKQDVYEIIELTEAYYRLEGLMK